ncbi:MAG: hypothetical protein HY665_01670 [Chloroflexi bacterium]|nr:hypothetical protein [Chloroflexota bacterium]
MTRRMLLLASMVVLVLGVSLGCKKQLTAYEIGSNAVAANAKLEAYKSDVDLTMVMAKTSGPQPHRVNIIGEATTFVDNTVKEAKVSMKVSLSAPGGYKKEEATIEMYFAGDWLYTKRMASKTRARWIKMKSPEDTSRWQSQIAQQIDFLKTASDVSTLGTENVDGTDYYVLKMTPDKDTIIKMFLAQQQMSGLVDLDLTELALARMVKSFSIKEWIAKDTYLLKKSEMDMLLDARGLSSENATKGSEEVTIYYNVTARFYDYNQRTPISVPKEALDAPEMPLDKKAMVD